MVGKQNARVKLDYKVGDLLNYDSCRVFGQVIGVDHDNV